MKNLILVVLATTVIVGVHGGPDTVQLIVNSCDKIEQQVHDTFGSDSIEEPTTNLGKHVSCIEDGSIRGPVLQLNLYDSDDDPIGNIDRQRMEIKGDTSGWKASQDNSVYTYSWWFQLNPDLIAFNSFFHIFQLKTDTASSRQDPAYRNPVFTFSLSENNGLYMRATVDPHAGPSGVEKIKMLTLQKGHALGQWINAQVDVKYTTSTTGYVQVTLKNADGKVLFPEKENQKSKVTYRTLWKPVAFVRPKWGLYRAVPSGDNQFNEHDWLLLDDIILKRNHSEL